LIQTQTTANNPTINVAAADGVINDSGQILNFYNAATGVAAIAVIGPATVDINNNVAAATIFSAQGPAIDVSTGKMTGTITNSGKIQTANGGGYGLGAIVVETGASITGGIVNNAGGVIQGDAGGDAVTLKGSADITNTGTIQQINGGAFGRAIDIEASITSTITNKAGATISSTGTGVGANTIVLASGAITVTGSILNSGTIVANGTNASAIALGGGAVLTGTLTNNAGGTIEAKAGNSAVAVGLFSGVATKIAGG